MKGLFSKRMARLSFMLLFLYMVSLLNAQNYCVGCTETIDIDTEVGFQVNPGQVICISSGVTCSGLIELKGGTLCNHGTITQLSLQNGSGIIDNYGDIFCTDDNISLSGNLNLNIYDGGFKFSNCASFQIHEGDLMQMDVYNETMVEFQTDLSFTGGQIIINNGRAWEHDPTNTNTSYINFQNVEFTNINLTLENSLTGGIVTANGLQFNNRGNKNITNNGIVTVGGALTISGEGEGAVVQIQNYNQIGITSNLDVSISGASFEFTTLNGTSAAGVLDVGGNLVLNSEDAVITNNGVTNISGGLTMYAGSLTNNLTLHVDHSSSKSGGAFTNNHSAYMAGFTNSGGSFVNGDNSYLSVSGSFVNSATTTLGKQSYIITDGYNNYAGANITGPSLTAAEAADKQHAKIIISGTSTNSGVITGYVMVFDKSLTASASNNGYGFDTVNNPSNIGSNVSFASTSNGTSVDIDCSWLASISSLQASAPTNTFCPYGGFLPAYLNAQMYSYYNGIGGTNTYSSPVSATYVWQPGGMTGQNPAVSPTVTTVYTVTATYYGCVFTQTVIVYIAPVVIPTITYSTTPFSSTATAVFNPTQTGVNTGVYSMGPSCPGVSINPTTGQITVVPMGVVCFGTYTVYYCIAWDQDGSEFCEGYCATTTITLENFDCPITVPVNRFDLCPEDKVQLIATGGSGTLYWAPAPTSLTAGINCTACPIPTLTFGGGHTQYTVTSYRGDKVCGSALIDVYPKEFCETQIVGCCFSNYGASVWLHDDKTYINVYCNLVNELGLTAIDGQSVTQQGDFTNQQGAVRVKLDWIHNAKNTLYTIAQGTTSTFGADQKMKGNSNTHFNVLNLNGNGTKSIWIDEYANSNLDLTYNILSIQNYNFFMKNRNAVVKRTGGYATTGEFGYFSWYMATPVQLTPQKYLFPLGAQASASVPFRYRPLVMANNHTGQNDELSANFMNIAPSLLTDVAFINANPNLTNLITNQSPSVLQINNAFYHKIKNTVPPANTSNLEIKSYYITADGQFQSLAEWEKDPNQTLDWWGTTPGSNSSNTPSSDPGTLGMIYAMTNGTLSFSHIPFTLARGGFFINTTNFGNSNNGGNGTVITVTATPQGGNPTPTGGGLGGPVGTGTNSGNNGNGGPMIFSPSPVAGLYEMTVTPPNNCAVPGKIKFIIDQNGNINPSTVEYGLASQVPYLGELSEAVYTIDNINTGITFSANPNSLLKNCVNTITVTTSTGNDYVINNGETINMTLPTQSPGNTISYGQFKLYNNASMNVFTYATPVAGSNVITLPVFPALPPGVYRFEMLVTASASPPISEMLKGQLIIK
jgi:hypothetical protein